MTEPFSGPIDGQPPETGANIPRDPAVIYPLIADSGNKRVLCGWIEGHDDYAVADDGPLCEASFDICLVDQPALVEYSESVKTVKAAAEPALLPVLLLVSDLNSELSNTDSGDLADNVFTTTVDELISLPIRQAELEWRLNTLRRLRTQSLNLKARTERLRKFRKAVEASGHGILITNVAGTIEYINPAFEDITGYSSHEAVGDTPRMLKSGEMSDSFYAHLWETITAGETWSGEIVNRRKDEEIYVADQTIAPITNEVGEITAYVAVQTDITEQKQLENRLKRHRDIVQRLEDPIMLQDTDDQFVLVNDALCEFAGRSAEELKGTDEYAFMDEPTARFIHRQKQIVRWTEQPVTYSVTPAFEYSRKEAVFYTSRYPYYDEDGELVGTLAICRDVTDLDERTRQLHVLDNILRHNIRNSLNVIVGQGDELRSAVDGDLQGAAETIVKAADDLLTTSEKSHKITQVLSEDAEIKRIDLTRILEQTAAALADEWPTVDLSVSPPDKLVVTAHPAIEAALKELFVNAAAHNDHETPRVEVTTTVDDEMALVRVADNGPGIPAFDREVLESGTAIETLSHGSGLGLWLVYWVVRRSGGKVTVSDRDSVGTTVTVSLPAVSTTIDN
ncbi:PAS domain-containing protein [Halalkalirubrum salinum]|uniref:PAS domain-containing protein n=1 Tax=Halalkalirubrum salinum TaxID=2563889 RepID=UPI0010FBA000|nr:PAS domain S-box protein [Halalkalirubrum salinum]